MIASKSLIEKEKKVKHTIFAKQATICKSFSIEFLINLTDRV